MGISLNKLIYYEPNPTTLKNPFEKWRLIKVNESELSNWYRLNSSAKIIRNRDCTHLDTLSKKVGGRKMKRGTSANGSNYRQLTHLFFGSNLRVKNGSSRESKTASAYEHEEPGNSTGNNITSSSMHLNSTFLHVAQPSFQHHHHNSHPRQDNHRLGSIMVGKRFAHFAIPSMLTFLAFALIFGIIFCVFEQLRRRRLLMTSRGNPTRQRGTPRTFSRDKESAKVVDAHVVPPILIPLQSEPCSLGKEACDPHPDILKLRKILKKIIGHFTQLAQVGKIYSINGTLKAKTLKIDEALEKEEAPKTVLYFSGTCGYNDANITNKKEVEQENNVDITLLYNKTNWHPQQQQTCISIV